MRYKKGQVLITTRDLDLLNMIARARFITRRQLTHISSPNESDKSYSIKLNWRIRRLLREKLITETTLPLQESFLTIAPRGLAVLKMLDTAFETRTHDLRIFPPNPHSRFRSHEIMLAEIWAAFKKSGKLIQWTTSFELGIAAKKKAPESVKRYDALAILETPKGACQIAIEYERLVKSKRNYSKIIYTMQNDVHAPLVLYVCATDQLKMDLICKFVGSSKVFFVSERNILWNPMGALVEQYRPDLGPVIERLENVLATVCSTNLELSS
jgi:hypothetical protein